MISVIVPYWNSEKWIGRCVRSMKTNDGDFEFILVNDHSDDRGEAVARSEAAGDERFRFIESRHMRGPSGARNAGLDEARGEWITFIDADDEMLPDAFRVYADVIRQKDANIHQLNHLRYYAKTGRIGMKYANDAGVYRVQDPPELWCGVWNKIIRAEFLKEIRFDESMIYGEDGMFVLECLARDGRIHHGSRHMVAVLHRLENMESLSHMKTLDDMIDQAHRYERFMLRQNDPEIRLLVCREIAKIWESKSMKRLVAPEKI